MDSAQHEIHGDISPDEDMLQAMLREVKQAKSEDADNDVVKDVGDNESIAEVPSPLRRFCKMARKAVRFASWKVCHSIHEIFSKLAEQSSLPTSNVWQMVLVHFGSWVSATAP